MRAHRITSLGEAAPARRLAPKELPGERPAPRAGRGTARHAGCRVAVALALGFAASAAAAAPDRVDAGAPASRPGVTGDSVPGLPAPALVVTGPADGAAGDAPELPDAAPTLPDTASPPDAATPPHAPGPVLAPLGRAAGMLPPSRAKGRRHQAAGSMPGCTGMATLDGVSAALQAGRFGRGKGLAIMQFRNVVTDREEDGHVACHSDVLLSDGSLHRAEYDLRRVRRGTRLHIEVAGEREDTAPGEMPAQAPAVPAPPDAGASVLPPAAAGVRVPAT